MTDDVLAKEAYRRGRTEALEEAATVIEGLTVLDPVVAAAILRALKRLDRPGTDVFH